MLNYYWKQENIKDRVKSMTDIQKMLNYTYDECYQFLITKYGAAQGDYFLRNNYKSKNQRITRGKEGLYIHHMDEDKAIMLSDKRFILSWNESFPKNPYLYAWQKADRLVYCNLLEHLVLHIKIMESPNRYKLPMQDVGVGGVMNFIVPELNDIYSGIQYKQPWKQKVVENVINLKKDYLMCLKIINTNFKKINIFTSFNVNFPQTGWSLKHNEALFKEIIDFLKNN